MSNPISRLLAQAQGPEAAKALASGDTARQVRQIQRQGNVYLVSALPDATNAPYDGQEILIRIGSGEGLVWRFRYSIDAVNSGQHPWEFIGGSNLHSAVPGSGLYTFGSASFGTVWASMPSGPLITLPFKGLYRIEAQVQAVHNAFSGLLGLGVRATIAGGNTSYVSYFSSNTINERSSLAIVAQDMAAAADGEVVSLQITGNNTTASAWALNDSFISVRPQAVG